MEPSQAPFLRQDGQPWRLWRGDSQEFSAFDLAKTRHQSGFFFASDRRQAEFYARPYLKEVFIRSQNPLDLRRDDIPTMKWVQAWGERYDDWTDRYSGEETTAFDFVSTGTLYDYEGTGTGNRWNDLFRFANAQGYDSVIVLDVTDGSQEPIVVCFHPSQIHLITTHENSRNLASHSR